MDAEVWAAWAQATGTTAAAMIAAGALAWGVRDKHRGQAEWISVWHDGYLMVRNGSALPAWVIDVAVVDRHGARQDNNGQASLLPGEEWRALEQLDQRWPYESFARGDMRLELRFTDAAGRRWLRNWPKGRLKRIWRVQDAGLPE